MDSGRQIATRGIDISLSIPRKMPQAITIHSLMVIHPYRGCKRRLNGRLKGLGLSRWSIGKVKRSESKQTQFKVPTSKVNACDGGVA
jgi:hypothetical protein